MNPVLFTIYGVNFYSYGLFVALAFLTCYLLMNYFTKKNKLSSKLLLEKLLGILLGGIVFSRILFYILYDMGTLPWYSIFNLNEGGMVSFGGIVGGFILFFIFFKKDIWNYTDVMGLSFIAAAAVWRIGCFMVHDHPGIFSTAWYAINFEAPAILFEIIGSVLGFILFFYLYQKKYFHPGIIFFLILSWYGLTRIVVDAFRDDPLIYNLHGGQIAGMIMVAVSIIGILILKFIIYKEKNAKIKS